MEIEYSEDDKYIDDIIDKIETKASSIVSYFGIENMPVIKVIIKNDLEEFRKDNAKAFGYNVESVPDWACGFAKNNLIEVLAYPLYIKTKGHTNATIDNLINTILHEFVHSCHYQINKKNLTWVSEGLATNISGQHENSNFLLDASLDDIKTKTVNYSNYYLMFKYLLDNYDKDYIFKVISDYDLQNSITQEVYSSVSSLYKRKK